MENSAFFGPDSVEVLFACGTVPFFAPVDDGIDSGWLLKRDADDRSEPECIPKEVKLQHDARRASNVHTE